MLRTSNLLIPTALAAAILLSPHTVHAGRTTGPTYTLLWRASTSVYPGGVEVIKWSVPRGMNDFGDVVGQACWDARDVDPDNSGENWEAFLAIAQPNGTYVAQNLNDLLATALPDGWRLTDAVDINNLGDIIGAAEYRKVIDGSVVQMFGTFRYAPTQLGGAPVLQILTYGPESAWTKATSINDHGDMLVHLDGGGGLHPYIYSLDGSWTVVPDPSGGIGVWQANALNQFGDIAGNARFGDYVHAVRYNSASGTTESLGWLRNPGPNRWGHGEDINKSGQVVGTSTIGTTVHAFRFTSGTMQDLGALGKSKTYGYGINDAGDCVGNAPDSQRAFVYTDSKGMIDLKAALAGSVRPLPPDFNQLPLQALRINNMRDSKGNSAGWILGRLGVQACILVPN